VVSCILLGGCGGSTPSTPSTPGPTPTASSSPEPASLGFLHVLQGSSVATHAIDAATGQLRPSTTQDIGDAHTLTGEPQGRYVYAAFGPRGGSPYLDPTIVAYASDPASGSLTKVSEASSQPFWGGAAGRWDWLSASVTRVYGMWATITYHDWYPAYVTHPVGNDGQLGPAYVRDFGEQDHGRMTVDVESDVLYKTGETALTAHVVTPDGSLRQAGESNLCVAAQLEYAEPLVAVRGFVFGWADRGVGAPTTCSWEGPRLAPRANLGLSSRYAAALALPDGASPFTLSTRPTALVAMKTSYDVRRGDHYLAVYEIRLFAMGEHGDLELLDTVEPGFEWKGLFHPSGKFLYVSEVAYESAQPQKLTVYSIDPHGHLAVIETVEGGGGTMAVTLAPQVRATTGSADGLI
jgi:hypothetical protein